MGIFWQLDRRIASGHTEFRRRESRFHARDARLVLGSAAGKPIGFRVKIDGKEPGDRHAVHTNALGDGTITEHRLYQLVRQKGNVDDHTPGRTVLPGRWGHSGVL
jgi:hypothetical protein